MFKFAYPYLLWFLLLIPVMLLVYWLMSRWRKKALEKFGDTVLVQQLMPDVSTFKTRWKLIFQLLAILFIVIGISRPQMGSKLEEVKREGTDIMIALDVSNSMLAEDLTPNRLEYAKRSMSKFIDGLKGDRIGIVIFAGEAFVQLPITTDYSAAKLFISSLTTEAVGAQGTAISAAINLSAKSLLAKEESSKSIIIISDGENHEEGAVESAEEAASKGIKIHCVGIGSPNGVPIPNYKNGVLQGYKKDNEGNTVVTRLNEDILKQITAKGSGVYVRGSNAFSGLDDVLEEINKMDKTEYESKTYTEFEEQFQWFIGLGLIFLLIDFYFTRRKSKYFSKVNLFEEKQ